MEEEFIRLGCQMNELLGDTLSRHGQVDRCSQIRLVYLHSSHSETAERSPESKELIPLILEEFGIRGQYEFINVTNDRNDLSLDVLDDYMSSHLKDIVLLVNALGSDLLYSTVMYLDARGYTNYLALNSFSTLDNAVLNHPRVIRIVPRDGSNALLFKALLDSVTTDHRLLLVDELDKWAVGLADSIQSVTSNITRYDLGDLVDGTVTLPQGTLSIIALASPAIPSLFSILPQRTVDVRLLLLGDPDNGVKPATTQELQYLAAWNTKMIVPEINVDVMDEFITRTDYTNVSNSLGALISLIQLASYLKYTIVHDSRLLLDSNGQINALYILPSIRNYYINLALDQLTMDVIASNYDVVYFTEVGLPATSVDTIGVSQIVDGDIRMYIADRQLS